MTRSVITEKYKTWDYIDNAGLFVWINKQGKIIKKEDRTGNLFGVLTLDWNQELGREIADWGVEAQFEVEHMMERAFDKSYTVEMLEAKFNMELVHKDYVKVHNLEFDMENNMVTASIKLKA